jgi:hypothetical protein
MISREYLVLGLHNKISTFYVFDGADYNFYLIFAEMNLFVSQDNIW